MNTVELEKLIALFVDDVALDDQQRELLRQQIENDPQWIAQINDDRAVDGLLQLLVAADESTFLAGCLEKFETETKLTSSGRIRKPGLRPKLQIANDFASRIQTSKRATSSTTEPIDQPVAEIDAKFVRSRHTVDSKRRIRNQIAAMLAFAACVMALASLAIWFGQSEPETAGREKTVKIQNLESDKIVAENDANSKVDDADERKNLLDHLARELADTSGSDQSATADLDRKAELPIKADVNPDNAMAPDTTDKMANKNSQDQSIRATGFANLIERDAAWKNTSALPLPANAQSSKGNSRIGPGEFELLDGVAHIKFDNGVQLSLLGPAVLNVVSDQLVMLERGSLLAELSQSVPAFEIGMKDVSLTSTANGIVQLTVSDEGIVQAYVDQGEVTLRHSDNSKLGPIVLAKGKLNQAIVTPDEHQNNVPSISVAQGNGTFLGQIGVEDKSLEVASPQMFSQLLGHLARGHRDETELQVEFNKLLSEFGTVAHDSINPDPSQSNARVDSQSDPTDGGISVAQQHNSSSMFRGSLNINGQQSSFDNQQDYEQALNKFVEGFNSGMLDDRSPMQKFDLERGFEFGGKMLKFTLPEDFRKLRLKMSQ